MGRLLSTDIHFQSLRQGREDLMYVSLVKLLTRIASLSSYIRTTLTPPHNETGRKSRWAYYFAVKVVNRRMLS